MGSDRVIVPPILQLAADPLRWALLTELARSDLRVGELVEILGEPQNLVSYHLRVLREGGLVGATRSTHDGRETYYHLDLDRWANELSATRAALHTPLGHQPDPGPHVKAQHRGGISVLFICTGNSTRSPMAEAMLRKRIDRQWEVASAGSHPKPEFHPLAASVLRQSYNLRLRGPRPRHWSALSDEEFDCVISLCDKARDAWTRDSGRQPWAHWSIPDPAAADDIGAFQRAARDIDTRVGHLVEAIVASHS